ncbi:tetratricopeptide repeat protein [Gimesia fumaroli]|uniref:Photosystem I assembly protein Ycf3 n=1 Tax=Gimesia fumaroli TaxID=2527976 RepID=A0A518I8V4_9PLAN|nr:tetratricopeptide repeat protein [Gimesia fumaroli]QDV49479.1 photosystem I assembly protein Ycf3 [Gimesia fumaroli]
MRNSTTWSLVILSGFATLFTVGCSHTHNMVGTNLKLPLEESPQMIMARTAEDKGQFVDAERTYKVMLQRNPQNATVLNRMGIVSSKMGKHDSATKYLMEAVKIQPNNAKYLTDLGYALYLQNDLPAAEIALEESIKRDPSSKRSFNNMSLVLGHQGRMDEAYQVARTVMNADEAHANIGYICLQRGMLDDAAKHYNRALEMNPDLDSVKEAIVQIAELQKQQMPSVEPQPEIQIAQTPAAEPVVSEPAVVTEVAETSSEETQFRVISDADVEVINPEQIAATELPVAQISAVQELPIQGFEPPLNVSNDDYIPSESNDFFVTVQSTQSVTTVRSAEE